MVISSSNTTEDLLERSATLEDDDLVRLNNWDMGLQKSNTATKFLHTQKKKNLYDKAKMIVEGNNAKLEV